MNMLTIQPKITSYSKPAVSFKANEGNDENYFKEKVDYYKQKAKEYEAMASDSNTPKGFRKVMRGFGVISEALLEGWAVAWGASKGAKILKSGVIKGAESKFVKHSKEVLKPVAEGIKSSGKKVAELFTKVIDNIKTSKVAEKLTNFVGKMKEHKVGKYIVEGFEYIGKALKYVGKLIANGAKKIAEPFKNKPASEIYDKGAKAASVTLGVGAGAAGAYNAATNATERKNAEENANIVDDEFNAGEEE